MTTLQIASDIHLEMRAASAASATRFEDILTPSADVLALVGDIGSPLQDTLSQFIGWCSMRFKHVLFVHGNHEFYNQHGICVMDIVTQLEKICAAFPNVTYLNNRSIVVEGVCFIGSPLWSNVPDALKESVRQKMNDYRCIFRTPNVPVTVDDTNAEFVKNKAYLHGAIGKACTEGYWPVVLTHHVPCTTGTSHPRFDGKPENCAFASDIPASDAHIQLWVAGHTHFNFNHRLAGYQLVSNQFGYGDRGMSTYRPTMSIPLRASKSN